MGSDAEQAGRARRFWGSVWESVRGTEQDFTEGSLGRAILLLSVPMVLEMSMEATFALVDTFFVAKLGADAVAVVGVTEAILSGVYAVAMGPGMATTAMVARRVGEKKPEEAAVAAVQAALLGLIVSVLIGLAGVLFSGRLLESMGVSPAAAKAGGGYTTIILGGSITVLMLFLGNAIFRGAGDAVIAMQVLWISNGINVVLDPCLIFGWGPFPELGLKGAAVATTIGRGIGVLLQVYVLFSRRGRVTLRRRHMVFEWRVMRRLLRVGATGAGQFLIADAAWIGLVRIAAIFGSAVLAGYTIAIRIVFVTILPAWGMANAAATLVGQNLGAGKPERAEQSVWRTGFYNMVFLGLVGLGFVLYAEHPVRVFTGDPAIIPYAVDCLRYFSYGYLFYAYGMVMVQAFNGAGDTVTPAVINVFVYWLWQIPLAYALALPLDLGPRGVFLAVTIAESTLAVAGMLVFRRGRWKRQKI